MARYYRRRTYTRVVKPKKKWASNIKQGSLSGTTKFLNESLVENSVQSSSPTPVIVKAGNFKVQGDIFMTSGAVQTDASATVYVVYLPEGVSPTDDTGAKNLINAHPEWVLAWKLVSCNLISPSGIDNGNSFTFSSRLKRNLNSGDRIELWCVSTVSGTLTQFSFRYAVQYWTCAN